DDVVVQLGAESARDRLGGFQRGKLDRGLSERPACKRRNGDRARLSAVEKSLDLAVADHAVEQASPAGSVAPPKQGPNQREGAGGLYQQPRRAFRRPLLVQFSEPPFEIVVDQRDRQVG